MADARIENARRVLEYTRESNDPPEVDVVCLRSALMQVLEAHDEAEADLVGALRHVYRELQNPGLGDALNTIREKVDTYGRRESAGTPEGAGQ